MLWPSRETPPIVINIYTFLNLEITNNGANGANFGALVRRTKATRLSVWNFAAWNPDWGTPVPCWGSASEPRDGISLCTHYVMYPFQKSWLCISSMSHYSSQGGTGDKCPFRPSPDMEMSDFSLSYYISIALTFVWYEWIIQRQIFPVVCVNKSSKPKNQADHKYSVSVCCYYSSVDAITLPGTAFWLKLKKLSVVRCMDHYKKGKSTSLYKSLIINIEIQTPLKTVYRVIV